MSIVELLVSSLEHRRKLIKADDKQNRITLDKEKTRSTTSVTSPKRFQSSKTLKGLHNVPTYLLEAARMDVFV